MATHQQIRSGAAALASEVSGQGDPMVFLHAAACDSRMWRAQLDSVGASNKAVAYDRRGCGGTRAEMEDHSAVADLMAVLDTVANDTPAILVACSQGGRIALDAALLHPSRVRGLFLIAPSVSGAPTATYPPEITGVMAQLTAAEAVGDLDQVIAIKARLWLDGPLAAEGRVTGEARRLFSDMHATALRAQAAGPDLDAAPAFGRLGELQMPALVIWGTLDFPHIQERCRHVVGVMPDGSGHELVGAAHLPSLERPMDINRLLTEFIARCSTRPG